MRVAFLNQNAILYIWAVKTGNSSEKPLALYLLIWVNCRLEV
jgi:hypothetical protein